MKALVAIIFAAGVSLTTLSSAHAITAAPLAEAARETSSVLDVQACGRGTQLTPQGCRAISYGYKKKSAGKKKKSKKKKSTK